MIEGAPFAIQALERWPDKVRVAEADDGVPGITIEGRRYPEPTGPGAGCPPANSLNTAEGIDPTTVGGMLADADREGIDRMVLYPSLGIAIPGFEDPVFAGEFAGLYNRYVGDWCRDRSRLGHPWQIRHRCNLLLRFVYCSVCIKTICHGATVLA